MKLQAVFLFLMLFSSNIAATTIYRWVDKNNIAHFSQQPPEGVAYTEMIIRNRVQGSNNQKDNAANTEMISRLADEFEQNAKARCENAKTNLDKLKRFAKIEVTDSEGKTKLMSDTEKLEQMRLSEKQIEVYCKS